MLCCIFFFQAEDGIRYLVRSRGLGDVYKRQDQAGRVIDPGFQLAQRWIDGAFPAQKIVIDHLFRQAALKIEQDWHAKEPSNHLADEGAFVQMRMNDIETLGSHHPVSYTHLTLPTSDLV